mgnify:FL=1
MERQAKEYFSNPNYYPISEDEPRYVKGFIALFYGVDAEGEAVFKSTGEVVYVGLDDIENEIEIERLLRDVGFILNELVQVKFYSPFLASIVGMKDYAEGEKKELVKHSVEYPNILYAVPDAAEVEFGNDDSIYDSLDKALKEEFMYGRNAEDVLGKQGFAHWAVTREFFETRANAIEEDKAEEARARSIKERKLIFQKKFDSEMELIEQLNAGVLDLAQFISDASAHLINRILYVSRSSSFDVKLKSRQLITQLVAASRYKEQMEQENDNLVPIGKDIEAVELINRINAGEQIDVDKLSEQLLVETLQILWRRSAVKHRIKHEFVRTYFLLKERFKMLRSHKVAA